MRFTLHDNLDLIINSSGIDVIISELKTTSSVSPDKINSISYFLKGLKINFQINQSYYSVTILNLEETDMSNDIKYFEESVDNDNSLIEKKLSKLKLRISSNSKAASLIFSNSLSSIN